MIIYILISKVKPGVLRETLRQKVEHILDENPTFGLTNLSKELMELALENQRAFDAAKLNAKKPTPEKRKMDDDLSSGRDTKRICPDDGGPKLSRRERKRLRRRDHDGGKGGDKGGGDAGGNNPPPAGGKPSASDKSPWKGNTGNDRRNYRGGRGRGRGDGGRGRGRGRPHNREQYNAEPVYRDAGYHVDTSEPKKDQVKRTATPWARTQLSNPEKRVQANEPAGEREPAATGCAKARAVSIDQPEKELPASEQAKSYQKADDSIHAPTTRSNLLYDAAF
ncbi:hypothetical protein DYB32_006390 [Aphanomyces invadans]|uniref:Uncharacterized protein n=1 Tax=Aphanomyces invadans TaxID=157072 RepID=A0A3R6YWR6_9STRA|nr:hypothetical protein DYB32_006390 [Aphanomyces invadans]